MITDEYKRQIDLWIKIAVFATPILSGLVSWTVFKTSIKYDIRAVDDKAKISDARLTKIETWIENQTKAMVESAKATGQTAERQSETNRRLERIEVILDSRLKH